MGHYRRRGIFRYAVAMTRGAGERPGCGRQQRCAGGSIMPSRRAVSHPRWALSRPPRFG
jgi:hypothetical protein